MKKKIILGAVAVFATMLIVAGVLSSGTDVAKADDAEFAKYIAAYTSDVISKNSSVKVRLASDIAEGLDQNTDLPSDLIEFTPEIKGTYFWSDNKTIEFKPDSKLPSGVKYEAIFNLGKILETPKGLESFGFSFGTIMQSFEVEIDQQITIDKEKLKWQRVTGTLRTADVETIEDIQKVLTATQDGKDLKISWIANEIDKTYIFEIDSVSRQKTASKLFLNWDGKDIGVKKSGDLTLEVPSLKDFKIMSSKVVQKPEQYLQLQFSDPLKPQQDLEGLIDIPSVSNLTYIIEDNLIKIYSSEPISGSYDVKVSKGIKNILGYKLPKDKIIPVTFEELKPAVRMINKGVILPTTNTGLVLPFEAVNIKAVDVRIVKIFENNITQFLQVNDFKGENELRRVAKPIIQKTIRLDKSDVVDFGRWNRFTLDLNELISADPGAIYRVSIGFRKKHSFFSCEDEAEEDETADDLQAYEDDWNEEENQTSYWDGIQDYYQYGDYWTYWDNRDNPCHDAYYGKDKAVSQNIIASNIGLITKRGNDNSLKVFATDLRTAKPISNASIELYDFQNQLISSKPTDLDGVVDFLPLKDIYFVVAKDGDERGYLKLNDGASLSLSRFDVTGKSISKGIKGFIYGERGVWRPGDSLFVSFILQEMAEPLPENHPIVFEMKNSNGQLVKRIVRKKNKTGFYTFRTKTDEEAPTGNWQAIVSVGGSTFYKKLKIETVKPNRLKIKFDFTQKQLMVGELASAVMNVKWLHGAIAKDLDAKVDIVLRPLKTTYPKYSDFIFDDPTKHFYAEADNIFDGEVDEKGNATINAKLSAEESAPGKLSATFITKVFEPGGDFSIDRFSLPYNPYESYIGIKLPKGDKARGMLLTDTTHYAEIVILDSEGKKVTANHDVEMQLYKLNWRWWWDKSEDDLANYISRSHVQPIKKENITAKVGKSKWKFKIDYPAWGRYLVRAHDKTTGHSTAKVVYIDWPGWAGREQKSHGAGAAMLAFTADKNQYNVGEEVKITIPTANAGRALISIENGTKVLNTYWLDTKKGQSSFNFTATKEMSPNIYVSITLLQPHSQTANDLPIRMYGILPLAVEDPVTHLNPEIKMPTVLEADKPFNLTVSEKDGKPMTYTIAVVDEGLLDLTRFKTPEPWNEFYAKEALGVKTWDIYDWVIGAYGGKLERLLSIGGDDEEPNKKGRKANRFKPVVKFLGPFHIDGTSKTHKINMPQYIGSVRTMVIAGHNNAFGSAEKTCPVRKPLMLLASLPRVLSPGEIVRLPVNIFAMEKNIKNVSVEVKTNGLLKIEGKSKKTLKFNTIGEQTIDFELKVQSQIGIATVQVIATSGNKKAVYDVELDVRNPNPRVTEVMARLIEAGESWDTDYKAAGITGTNTGVLEVTSVPPLNLEKRLQFLIQYPHGCIEQTTSGAFPQLYVDKLIDLDQKRKNEINKNVKAAIRQISKFQHSSGGLKYWPTNSDVNEWCTNYAGHFLIEAQKRGYNVPSNLMKKWVKYQQNTARSWSDIGKGSKFIQAYRLYTLALAGKAEKGAMNRLKEKDLEPKTKWRLAAAYYLSGKKKIAEAMIDGLSSEMADYKELSNTFGTATRDKAMILETLSLMNRRKEAFMILKKVAQELSDQKWLSTQTTAYALIAVSQYCTSSDLNSNIQFTYNFDNSAKNNISTKMPVSQTKLVKVLANGKISVKNSGSNVIYARLIMQGIPEIGETTDASNQLKLDVQYKLMDGTKITPNKIEQGTDFMAEVKITHIGKIRTYKEMELNQIFPSGWEIINTRLLETGDFTKSSIPTYQDIRDDRVYTYFDIDRSKTKTYRVLLNATYTGKYYLPAVYSQAMYDATINARQHGQWVEVVKQGEM